jgi:uncharacterized protein (TIGR03435 family)
VPAPASGDFIKIALTRSQPIALAMLSCIVLSVSPSIHAQSPEFEVASVKENHDRSLVSFGPILENGTLRAVHVSLNSLILAAYGITKTRVSGPDWLEHEWFDISAKSPDGVPATEMKPMLQALLRDRFGLKVHSDLREMPVYHLVVAKGGPRMSVYPAPEKEMPTHPRGAPMIRGSMKMAQLCRALSNFTDRPVLDQTHLTERYSFGLVFAPPSSQTNDAAADVSDVLAAIQEQLGCVYSRGKRFWKSSSWIRLAGHLPGIRSS